MFANNKVPKIILILTFIIDRCMTNLTLSSHAMELGTCQSVSGSFKRPMKYAN